jgi:uncharacterized protein YndB with AHSA1/START domain
VDLVITRRFHAAIDDVWQSVTASESTAHWIGPWSGEPGPGNTVKLQMNFEDGAPTCDVSIEVCEPPRRLLVTSKDAYGHWRLQWTLSQRGDTTELEFVQHLADGAMVGDVGPGWEYYLDMLVAARNGQARPKFADYYPAQRDHYGNLAAALAKDHAND